MSDTDIVTWLRSILHNDRSVELRCQEAANEIERLRDEIEILKDIADSQSGQLADLSRNFTKISEENKEAKIRLDDMKENLEEARMLLGQMEEDYFRIREHNE